MRPAHGPFLTPAAWLTRHGRRRFNTRRSATESEAGHPVAPQRSRTRRHRRRPWPSCVCFHPTRFAFDSQAGQDSSLRSPGPAFDRGRSASSNNPATTHATDAGAGHQQRETPTEGGHSHARRPDGRIGGTSHDRAVRRAERTTDRESHPAPGELRAGLVLDGDRHLPRRRVGRAGVPAAARRQRDRGALPHRRLHPRSHHHGPGRGHRGAYLDGLRAGGQDRGRDPAQALASAAARTGCGGSAAGGAAAVRPRSGARRAERGRPRLRALLVRRFAGRRPARRAYRR